MDHSTRSTSSAFEPTPEQATFRFTSPPPHRNPGAEHPTTINHPTTEHLNTETPQPPTRTPPPSLASNYKPPTVEDLREPSALRPAAPPKSPTQEASPATETAPDLRTCRICFDSHPPPYAPHPQLGRLISPCTCRGSSRYVHAVCLRTWRLTSRTAYYQCPTCKYCYRLRRLSLASFLSSAGLQLFLTLSILLFITWTLGFVSEPILSSYLLDIPAGSSLELEMLDVPRGGWAEHFLRGLASLGLLGFLKVIYLIGPGSWWNLRTSGMLGGRDRVARITWIVVAIGVLNFFVWLWRKTGDVVRKRMQDVAAEVLEVGNGEVRERIGYREWGWGLVTGVWSKLAGVREVE